MRLVKCVYCEQILDRDKEDYVPVNNRYAHILCYQKEQERRKIIQEIHGKMKDLCGTNYSKNRIDKQIKELVQSGKTEIGILKTLEYWYDERHEDPAKSHGGIGIVDYIYGEAQDFFFRKAQNERRYRGKDIESFLKPEVVQVKIKPQAIKKPKRIKLFDLK